MDMGLTNEERKSVVQFRMEKAKNTFAEITLLRDNALWQTAANRLYYACYYAVSALLVQNEIEAQTHHGVINQIGLHFVRTGLLPIEQGKFYQQLFELQKTGDYSDWITVNESDIIPLVEPAKQFIETIEQLILKTNKK
jgi:uncharacterized protein (UPF0332 family)